MGRPKMSLSWGGTTVVGQVVRTLTEAGAGEIVVVTGGAQEEIQAALQGLEARLAFNPDYAEGEMARSLQVGLGELSEAAHAALVALGDQPQIETGIVQAVLNQFLESGAKLVVPSYRMRRGHPWIVARSLWPEVLALKPPHTLRDFLNANAGQILYLQVDNPSVLMDLDTPEDYRKYRPSEPD
jgi:molybdenum cofactor cytidylyltransferase